MYRFKSYVFANLVLLSVGNKCQDVRYEYAIEVPKYLCDKKENLKAGVTTIRLQGKDAQKLQYEFAVNYKNITICKPSQRCTLTAWRAVRNLEKHIKTVCASQKNLQEININNTLLIPGVQYVLNVAVTNNGTKVDDKEFLLECTNISANMQNGTTMHSEQTSHTSLVLLGSNITYRDIIYFLNAEAVDCNINCSYYFKWEILDDSEKLVLNDPTKGSELQISFQMLNTNDEYIIRCSLISIQRNVMIATALQTVNVARRDMRVKLAVSTLVVGLKKPIQLHAYIKYADDTGGKINIEWLCKYENRKQCSGFNKSQSSYQEKLHYITLENKGFVVVGRYNVTLIVKKGNIIKRDSCEIRVEANGFTKIAVDNTDDPVDPSKAIEVPVYVSNLMSTCMLQWKAVKTKNYAYLDLQTVPGNINVVTNITLTEDEFLTEIDEFSNGTTDIDYNLKIPAPIDNWKGLSGNTSYLFRLNVTCPMVQTEDYDDDDAVEDAEPLLLQRYVTLYADIVLQTDPAPVLNSLEVTPKQGTALKTLFKFVYQANGSENDKPMLYKFGYFLNNEIIFISNLLGVTDTKSVLPYMDSGVKTVLEGCNSRSLCAQIVGPVVITEVPLVSEEDQNNLRVQLSELMMREEYYKVFTYSLAILQTYNNANEESIATNMQYYISNLTSNEIKRLLMLSVDGDTRWRAPANNLIKNIGIFLNNFSASEVLLNNVVALRNELSRKNVLKLTAGGRNAEYRSRRLLMVEEPERFKRETEKMTLEDVKSYLVISELIITSSPDKKRVRQERENLLSQIDKFMHGLCATIYEKSQTMNLELRTMVLSVEKFNKNSFNRYAHILYTDNTWNVNGRIKLGKCFTEKLKFSEQLCLGKAALKNYLGKKGIVHMIKIYSTDPDEEQLFEDMVCDSVLVLPVDEKQVLEKEPKCALWKRHWTQSECRTIQITKNIQCNCNNLGYYAVEYVVPASTTTATTPVAVIVTTALTTTTEQIPATAAETIPAVATTPLAIDKEMLNEEQTTFATELEISMETESSTNGIPSTVEATLEISAGTDISQEFSLEPTEEAPYSDVVSTVNVSSTIDVSANNTLIATMFVSEDEDVIYYCITGFSVVGIAMLIYGIKHVWPKRENTSNNDFPKYAPIHHKEMLQDLPAPSSDRSNT